MSPKQFSLWIMIKDMFAPICGTRYGDSWGATDIQCPSSPFFCDFIPFHRPTALAEQPSLNTIAVAGKLRDAAGSLPAPALLLRWAMT